MGINLVIEQLATAEATQPTRTRRTGNWTRPVVKTHVTVVNLAIALNSVPELSKQSSVPSHTHSVRMQAVVWAHWCSLDLSNNSISDQ